MNDSVKSMVCIKCKKEFPVSDYLYGCPECFKKGENSNLTINYIERWEVNTEKKGMLRYEKMLPYNDIPTLGEGNTPVVRSEKLENKLGLEALYIKSEFQNPTGSHKDRMNPFIIARAEETGKKTVTAASSGNEGVSLAAYAAVRGMDCVIVSTKTINPIWKEAICAVGGQIVLTETPDDRLTYIQEKIETDGWYNATNLLDIPVGSNPFGIQGYKTIAYEIYEEMKDNMPEYILIPVSRGDLLYGIYQGFQDLTEAGQIKEIPRLVAVEPFKRIARVLEGADYRDKFPGDSFLTSSIGGPTVTYQSKLAIEGSKGLALDIEQEQIMESVECMGKAGFYLETSSAACYGCIKEAVESGKIPEKSRVLIIATSHGFKNAPGY